MQFSRGIAIIAALAAATLLAACAETELAVHTAKSVIGLGEEPPVEGAGGFKVGEPYQVEGVWYRPAVDPSYDETGIASWYGAPFHGRTTANGELYDMNALTAAHKTLPLPTRVRVTNLENGRSIVVRVNDRGPFVHGRIIDLSRRSAQLLGFEMAGTAKVRVTVLPPDEQEPATRLAMLKALGDETVVAANDRVASDVVVTTEEPFVEAAPFGEVTVAALEAPSAPVGAPPALAEASAPTPQMFIQVGAFTNPDNARLLELQLADIGRAQVLEARIDERMFYRVRLGPFDSLARADATLERLIAIGHPEARLIVD